MLPSPSARIRSPPPMRETRATTRRQPPRPSRSPSSKTRRRFSSLHLHRHHQHRRAGRSQRPRPAARHHCRRLERRTVRSRIVERRLPCPRAPAHRNNHSHQFPVPDRLERHANSQRRSGPTRPGRNCRPPGRSQLHRARRYRQRHLQRHHLLQAATTLLRIFRQQLPRLHDSHRQLQRQRLSKLDHQRDHQRYNLHAERRHHHHWNRQRRPADIRPLPAASTSTRLGITSPRPGSPAVPEPRRISS